MPNASTVTLSELGHYYGSEQLFFQPLFRGINYTEGVRYVLTKAGWLITDILAHLKHNPKLRGGQEFIAIEYDAANQCVKYTDGNGGKLLVQRYGIADCATSVKFFYTDGVLMLASEY